MMLLTFITAVVAIAAITIFLETKEDKCIIDGDKDGWKKWGLLKDGAYLTLITAGAFALTKDPVSLLLLPVLVGTYSVFHDCVISYRLHKDNPELSTFMKFFQLGKGKWDTGVLKIFQHGFIWFIAKMFWAVGAAYAYFSLKNK